MLKQVQHDEEGMFKPTHPRPSCLELQLSHAETRRRGDAEEEEKKRGRTGASLNTSRPTPSYRRKPGSMNTASEVLDDPQCKDSTKLSSWAPFANRKEREGFDKLSPNGKYVSVLPNGSLTLLHHSVRAEPVEAQFFSSSFFAPSRLRVKQNSPRPTHHRHPPHTAPQRQTPSAPPRLRANPKPANGRRSPPHLISARRAQ